MYEFEKNKTNEGNRKEMSSLLEEYCEKSSKNELRSIQCERDVNQMKFAEYMSKHIGEEFEATVSSVSNFGMFVQLPNTIEGLIKLASCKDDYYTFNEKTNELVGKRKGNRYSLGTKVKVKLILADKNTRKIEFELLQHLGNR
jgi:ribonuclease R